MRPSLTGGFWKPKNLTRICVFIRAFTYYILDPESDRTRLALFRILLADVWGEVSRPVFLLPRGVVWDFYDVVIFRQKYQHGLFTYNIYRRFSRKNRLIFFQIASETEKRELECIDIFSNCYPEETANGAACLSQNKWLVGLDEKRARFACFPVQTRLRRCWDIDFQKPTSGSPWPEEVIHLDLSVLLAHGFMNLFLIEHLCIHAQWLCRMSIIILDTYDRYDIPGTTYQSQ